MLPKTWQEQAGLAAGGQENSCTNKSLCPMTAGKQAQRRQTSDILKHDRVLNERDLRAGCKMSQGTSCPLPDPFHNILNIIHGVSDPQSGFKILAAYLSLNFWVCYVNGMQSLGQGSWRQYNLLCFIAGTVTGQISQYIVSKVHNIGSKM